MNFIQYCDGSSKAKLSYRSGTLGAKQDVVEWRHRTLSAPSSSILRSTASRSVRNSSPSRTFSTTTGSKPNTIKTKTWSKTGCTSQNIWNAATCCCLPAVTCCDHGFEAGLLVDSRPDDVPSLGSPMTQGQEAECQTHSRRHGNDEAARHAPHACEPNKTKRKSQQIVSWDLVTCPWWWDIHTWQLQDIQNDWVGQLVEQAGSCSFGLDGGDVARPTYAVD